MILRYARHLLSNETFFIHKRDQYPRRKLIPQVSLRIPNTLKLFVVSSEIQSHGVYVCERKKLFPIEYIDTFNYVSQK
jgi:hypothetical protein